MSSLLQDSNRQRFDSIAADWDDSPMRRAMAGGVAAAIAAAVPLQAQWQALEYGCGTGLVGAQLAPRLRHLLACDLSPGMLAVLDEKARAAGLDNLHTRVLDLTREAPPAQRFDLIFSSMTLHHIPDVPALLRVFHGMLQPGGWAALADLDAEDGSFHNPDVPGVAHHGFARAELTRWLRASGVSRHQRAHRAYGGENPRGQDRALPIFLITARR
ncbi:Methyltransferase type 11 [mine drainage metagenome]|uniref:Methyltransferase type 11 n=2 Tax=mine drainage metagenome TaxID=410659 RepID=T0YHS7_9ZZZZ